MKVKFESKIPNENVEVAIVFEVYLNNKTDNIAFREVRVLRPVVTQTRVRNDKLVSVLCNITKSVKQKQKIKIVSISYLRSL